MTLLDPLRAQLGADVVQYRGEFNSARHVRDFTIGPVSDAEILAIAYPRSTADVAAVLAYCNENDVKVVPQGGMTGLAGGGLPLGPCVVLALERMRAIEEIDVTASTMTVQAGVMLEAAQTAAEAAGLFFPLDLGARGSAQIGGNASTNAGGNRVVRYGMMRDLVLGAEWVLADGTVVTSLNKMIKNNAGYDLKQLLIGSEGTLGVITRLVLRLHPKPRCVCTALVAVERFDQVLGLLGRARSGLGATLSAFEMMMPDFYRLGTEALGRRPPLPLGDGVYVLMETMGDDEASDRARIEAVIGEAIEAGAALDAVIAQSAKEAAELWAIRDSPGEFYRVFSPQVTFDISIPTGQTGDFIDECRRRLQARWPGMGILFFGHVANSNLHITARTDLAIGEEDEVIAAVYQVTGDWNGSISAEHGIGVHKRAYLHHSRSPEEIALMRRLKAALDPKGTLNPGKVI